MNWVKERIGIFSLNMIALFTFVLFFISTKAGLEFVSGLYQACKNRFPEELAEVESEI